MGPGVALGLSECRLWSSVGLCRVWPEGGCQVSRASAPFPRFATSFGFLALFPLSSAKAPRPFPLAALKCRALAPCFPYQRLLFLRPGGPDHVL